MYPPDSEDTGPSPRRGVWTPGTPARLRGRVVAAGRVPAGPPSAPLPPGSPMAATYEISNVFSNYFSTMYNPEDPVLAPVPTAASFGADDLVLSLSNTQMPLEGPGGSPREGREGRAVWGARELGVGQERVWARGSELRHGGLAVAADSVAPGPFQRRPAGPGSSPSSGPRPRFWTGSATRWRRTSSTPAPSTSRAATWTARRSAAAPPRSCGWSSGLWGTSSTPSCGTSVSAPLRPWAPGPRVPVP